MVMLKLLSKLVKALRSDASPRQIGWGVALGAVIGLTPLWSLHNLGVLLLAVILPVNLAGFIFGWMVYGLVSLALTPVLHRIGTLVLVDISLLQSVWTGLYNAPIAPFTRFNNTIVMGGLLFSLILLWPNMALIRFLVVAFREKWEEAVKKWKIVQVLKGNSLFRFYLKIRNLGR